MSFTDSDQPSLELRHFTNRLDELKRFRQLLAYSRDQPLPVLCFYGVGGVGKSWLCRRLEQIRGAEKPAVRSATIDFDIRLEGGSRYRTASEAWVEIAKQLKISCPHFLLAYAVLRAKQTDAPLDGKNLSAGEKDKAEWLEQLTTTFLSSDALKAVSSDIPGLGLGGFLVRKGIEKAKEAKFRDNPDFQALLAKTGSGQMGQDLLYLWACSRL